MGFEWVAFRKPGTGFDWGRLCVFAEDYLGLGHERVKNPEGEI
jgi:hypothetical protein